ncbi:helix-turn-helix transcriptional regulator [Raoultibacter phocaeensis]|uniref:helix-turn-helix transcriptional regulator n=1 Tax=Raoultibacter phocaeensis TaxID=2479841 RepID=UPI0015D63166|nr:LuxR C-terminal-related transcriptional regulator [Raoultibacter phocaeensis]
MFSVHIPVLCLIGFSLYLGWIFCLFWSPSIVPMGIFSDYQIHLMRMAMTIAMFFAYVILGLFARFFASERGGALLKGISLVLSPMVCIVGFFSQGIGMPVAFALWAASGIGSSALLLVWSKKIVELTRKQVIFSVSSAFLIGAFLFISTAFMPMGIAYLAIGSLPVISVVFAVFAMSRSLTIDTDVLDGGKKREEHQSQAAGKPTSSCDENGDEGKSDRKVSFMRTILLALAYSVGIGFVGSCATVTAYYPDGLYVIAAGNAFAAIFTVLFLVRKPKDIAVILIEVFLPIMLVCIFLFSFVGHAGQLVCIFVMLALLACHDIVDIADVSKSSLLFGENYIRTFAVGRTLNGLGCTFGWIVGMALSFSPGIDASGRLFICFALVVFLVVITSFAVFHPGPLSYVRSVKMDAVLEARRASAIEGDPGALLHAKVERIAQMYDLTARQAEVLICLAQGRNASYIAQKFTISTHTAKSHIYNIYNKLSIHSQQELLDIVEVAQCEELTQRTPTSPADSHA